MHADSRELRKKSSVALICRIAGALIGFALTAIVARALGADGAGLYFLSLTVVTLLATLSRLGLDQTVTRFVGIYYEEHDWKEINATYRSVIIPTLATAAVFSSLLYFAAEPISTNLFQKTSLATVLRPMSWAILFTTGIWIHGHIYQGMRDVIRFQWYQNLGVAVIFVVTATTSLALAIHVTPQSFGALYLISSAFVFATAVIGWFRLPHTSWRTNSNHLKEMMPIALPLLSSTLLAQLIIAFPQIILGTHRTSSELGVYNAAFRTAQLVSLVLVASNSVALPKLAALYKAQELDRLKNVMIASTRYMIALCVPVLAVIFAFPDMILSFFGPGFEKGALPLRLMVVGQFINVATGSVGGLLSMTGNQKKLLHGYCLAFITTVTISFLAVPRYGIVGAAAAQALALTFQMLYFTYIVWQRFGFLPLSLGSSNLATRPARDES